MSVVWDLPAEGMGFTPRVGVPSERWAGPSGASLITPVPAKIEETPQLRWVVRAVEGVPAPGRPVARLGVLSGTFNPPTLAHLSLAREAARALELDEVLFVFPEIPPHKRGLEASLADRAEMLRRAVESEPHSSAAISSHGLLLEIHRAVAPHYPTATRTFFLLGSDAAERILLRWPYPDPSTALAEMFSRFEMGVAGRDRGFTIPPGSFAGLHREKIHALVLPLEYARLSSTLVRASAAVGESLQNMVGSAVAEFIRERGLYGGSR
jgi:nicotinate (nicotinamide) nucleotide adenylyltransferase